MARDVESGKFLPGTSGNPGGRMSNAARRLRELMEQDVELFYAQLVAGAKEGDPTCLKIYFDRILPALKPANPPTQLPALYAAANLTEATRAVTDAIARGDLSIEDGQRLLMGIGATVRVEEHDEVKRAIAGIQAKLGIKKETGDDV
ncbi:hypothetical protein QCE73_08910 [Caballeronia sp. LZ029]|uniref:DUF5681 domain-containing protein n=1 Tax=Caballeronia sp. LZ029 TaxID=3038564 RepID=UPI002857B9A5|nr:DUF5681 domain-containing protein [Caballeronia sp. LZ029]MDR5743273.1 hypothetical protein [Caballeronia sp. LZ029]